MRILLIHGDYANPPGGAEQYVSRMGASLLERGHDVLLATRFLDSPRDDIPTHQVRSSHPYRPSANTHGRITKGAWHAIDIFDPRALLHLRSTIRTWKPDLIHSHNFQGASGSLFALRQVPHVHTVHDFSLVDPATTLMSGPAKFKTQNRVMKARSDVFRRLSRHTTFVFPNAKTRVLHAQYGFAPDKNVVLPHGWDDPLNGTPRTAYEGSTRFLFAGRFTDMKGVELLLDTWADGVPGASLTFAGTGPLESRIKLAAERLQNVHFAGWVGPEAKHQLFAEHDVLLFPSLWPEVFPLVTVEAVRSGMPVIASALSSPPVVEHGVNGLLVEHDTQHLRQSIHQMRDLVGEYQRRTRTSRPQWAWSSHIDEIERLYGRVTSPR